MLDESYDLIGTCVGGVNGLFEVGVEILDNKKELIASYNANDARYDEEKDEVVIIIEV